MTVLLEELARRSSEDKLGDYRPYAKQKEFHFAGKDWNERLIMAGNQLGKTWCGGMEVTYHLTGLYPDWWQGLRFTKPVRVWVSSVTAELTRDAPQRILFGEIEDGWGTGTIPKRLIKKIRRSGRVVDGINFALIQHASGGVSRVQFKSYDQNVKSWQGATIDFQWFDEEPPIKHYTEGLARTNKGQLGQRVMMTFTPLMGMTDTVMRFISEDPKVKSPRGNVTRMGIKDVEHYTEEEKQAIIMSYPSHEREARTNGTPILGSGRVFTTAVEDITIAPFNIPSHWPVIAGIDIGWDHPAAAVKIAYDRDNDVVYIITCWRKREAGLSEHASAIRAMGDNIPVAWPQDALQHDKKSGHQYSVELAREGLNMCPHWARYPDVMDDGKMKTGTNSVEAGVIDMAQRCAQGRLKVFAGNDCFFDEYGMYHRKDGQIVRLNDDVLCATRYALMMVRYAEVPSNQWGNWNGGSSGESINQQVDDRWIL